MDFDSQSYLSGLADEMRNAGNELVANQQSKYMKNRFPFFGLKSPERKSIIRAYQEKYGIVPLEHLRDTVKTTYQYPERELHYFAVELMVKYKKKLDEAYLPLTQWLIVHHSWWDTVDLLAAHIVGTLCLKYSHVMQEVDTWIHHENMWLRRSAILYQLSYKEKTDAEKLFKFCAEHAFEKEFFIRKAIGWALREYAKYNTQAVLSFVEATQNLSSLSRREALKHIQ